MILSYRGRNDSTTYTALIAHRRFVYDGVWFEDKCCLQAAQYDVHVWQQVKHEHHATSQRDHYFVSLAVAHSLFCRVGLHVFGLDNRTTERR